MAQYDGVLASKMDRYTRARDWNTRQWAEENGKKLLLMNPELVWPPKPDDMTTPQIWDTLVNMAIAEWQSNSIRWRGLKAYRISQGSLVGRAPYTHRIVKTDNGLKTLEPDPERAEFILEAIDRFIAGKSRREIVRWLRESGAPWPTAREGWMPKTVNDLFRNEALIGRRKQGGKILRFEPVLVNDDGSTDMATWRKLQETLNATTSRHGKQRENPAMLNGVLYCGICKRKMHERHHPRKRKDGSVYVWNGYRCDGTAREPSECRLGVNMLEMDSNVDYFVLENFADDDYYETTVIAGHNHEDELEENLLDIASLDPDADDYPARHAELIAERKRLKALPSVPDTPKRVKMGTVGERWLAADTQGRRKLLLDMGWRIYVYSADYWHVKGSDDIERSWRVLSEGRPA
jgi:hypothetical protein